MEQDLGDSDEHHYVCGCGRSFPGPGPLNFHRRTCRSSKRRLQGALARAKELWETRKKPRLDSPALVEPVPSQNSEPEDLQVRFRSCETAASIGNLGGLTGQVASGVDSEMVRGTDLNPSRYSHIHTTVNF